MFVNFFNDGPLSQRDVVGVLESACSYYIRKQQSAIYADPLTRKKFYNSRVELSIRTYELPAHFRFSQIIDALRRVIDLDTSESLWYWQFGGLATSDYNFLDFHLSPKMLSAQRKS